jgi:hypothetical protein
MLVFISAHFLLPVEGQSLEVSDKIVVAVSKTLFLDMHPTSLFAKD